MRVALSFCVIFYDPCKALLISSSCVLFPFDVRSLSMTEGFGCSYRSRLRTDSGPSTVSAPAIKVTVLIVIHIYMAKCAPRFQRARFLFNICHSVEPFCMGKNPIDDEYPFFSHKMAVFNMVLERGNQPKKKHHKLSINLKSYNKLLIFDKIIVNFYFDKPFTTYSTFRPKILIECLIAIKNN